MINIMYIPLDERPCNYLYPLKISKESKDVRLLIPPISFLGQKKKPADIESLWNWVERNIKDCYFLIVSIDMLVYGGILPSRLHNISAEDCNNSLLRLAKLKKSYPNLKIFAFNLIMRVPSYNSDDEEPDYYAKYGENIFNYSWAFDKSNRGNASQNEIAALETFKAKIPKEILKDYLDRRAINSYVNSRVVELVNEGIIDFLVIPLDDCAEYGFSSSEQQSLLKKVENLNLQDKVYLYPGADELGCTMLARTVNTIRETVPKVFVRYSSDFGSGIIPKYEDRPLSEAIKYQIIASGGIPIENSIEADYVLMVNSPAVGGDGMCEAAFVETDKNRSYYSFRNVREFVLAIKNYIEEEKKCAIADVAFCNGSDVELMNMLGKSELLGKLTSYGAWNTASNTIGTVVAHSTIRYNQSNTVKSEFYIDRLVEDWGYQSDVRQRLVSLADSINISSEYLGEKEELFISTALKMLNEFVDNNLSEFKDVYDLVNVYFPWNRLFEIGLTSETRKT